MSVQRKGESESRLKPPRTNKWNQAKVKTSVDDAVRQIAVESLGLTESYRFLDIRLYLCVAACSIAGIATAYDYIKPFPASKIILVICCSLYFVILSILTWFMTYVEKEIFLFAVRKDSAGIEPDDCWYFSSTMERYNKHYKLTILYRAGNTIRSCEGSVTTSAEEWIDKDGIILMHEVEKVVSDLQRSLITKKTD